MAIRNILIEGMDCSGRSTLVNALKNRLGWDAKALGHRDGDQLRRYWWEYATLERTVLDRGHVSEELFSTVFDRERPFDEHELALLNRLVSEEMLIIFANPRLEVAQQRYVDRHDPTQKIAYEQLGQAHDLFEDWFGRFEARVIEYRSESFEELERLVKRVVRMVEGER